MKPARRFAEGTEVPAERSRAELEKLFTQAGATDYGSGRSPERAWVMLRLGGRTVRLGFAMPTPAAFARHGGRSRTPREQQALCDAELRRRWRVLVLLAKAKLEVIASGDSTVEREFLADLVLPDNTTVAELLRPQLEAAYQSAAMPRGLPAPGDR